MTDHLRFHTPGCENLSPGDNVHSLHFETIEGPEVEIVISEDNYRFMAADLQVDMEEELIAIVTRMRMLQRQLEHRKSLPAAMLATTAENIVDQYLEQMDTFQRMIAEIGESHE